MHPLRRRRQGVPPLHVTQQRHVPAKADACLALAPRDGEGAARAAEADRSGLVLVMDERHARAVIPGVRKLRVLVEAEGHADDASRGHRRAWKGRHVLFARSPPAQIGSSKMEGLEAQHSALQPPEDLSRAIPRLVTLSSAQVRGATDQGLGEGLCPWVDGRAIHRTATILILTTCTKSRLSQKIKVQRMSDRSMATNDRPGPWAPMSHAEGAALLP